MKLSIRHLTKEFTSYDQPDRNFRAVDDLSLEVGDGELVTLLGPSGCGKTTLLRMLAGFEDPTSGDIYFGGRRVVDLPPSQRGAAMVFQSYAIFPHLNVKENIVFGLRLQKLSEAEIERRFAAVVETVELGGLEERQPSQLSGGQQQRVALARAVIMEPEILLFDEPLSNLDAKLREQMRVDIRKLQKRLGITSVYVTHDQEEAMSISDRIVVMHHGCVEQAGSPRDLYSRPKNRFVANFIGKANFLPARFENGLWTLAGTPWTPPDSFEGCRESCTLMLRPEAIELADAGCGDLDATLTRITYLGSLVEYEAELAGGLSVTVHVPALLERVGAEPGGCAALKFLLGGLYQMPEEPAAD